METSILKLLYQEVIDMLSHKFVGTQGCFGNNSLVFSFPELLPFACLSYFLPPELFPAA